MLLLIDLFISSAVFYLLHVLTSLRVAAEDSLYSGYCGASVVEANQPQSTGSEYCECGAELTPQCRASPVSDCGSFSKAKSKKKGKSKKCKCMYHHGRQVLC